MSKYERLPRTEDGRNYVIQPGALEFAKLVGQPWTKMNVGELVQNGELDTDTWWLYQWLVGTLNYRQAKQDLPKELTDKWINDLTKISLNKVRGRLAKLEKVGLISRTMFVDFRMVDGKRKPYKIAMWSINEPKQPAKVNIADVDMEQTLAEMVADGFKIEEEPTLQADVIEQPRAERVEVVCKAPKPQPMQAGWTKEKTHSLYESLAHCRWYDDSKECKVIKATYSAFKNTNNREPSERELREIMRKAIEGIPQSTLTALEK